MNRLKKELQRKGVKLACNFDYLPFKVSHSNNIYIDDVIVNSENASVTIIYNTLIDTIILKRDGSFAFD